MGGLDFNPQPIRLRPKLASRLLLPKVVPILYKIIVDREISSCTKLISRACSVEQISGSGSDNVGRYRISGECSLATGRMGFCKKYIRGTGDARENKGHAVEYKVTHSLSHNYSTHSLTHSHTHTHTQLLARSSTHQPTHSLTPPRARCRGLYRRE